MHIWVCEHLPAQIIYAVLSAKGQWIPSENFSPTSTVSLHTPTSSPSFPPSLFSLVWSGADTRSNHRPGWMRSILRRVGKSQAPLQSTKSQLFPVPLQASGLEHAVKAISTTSSTLHYEWSFALGGISIAAPDTQQIYACTLSLLRPCRHVSPLERWISYDIVEVDQNIWARWHYRTSNSSVVVFQHNRIRWLNIRRESYWYSKRHHQQMAY